MPTPPWTTADAGDYYGTDLWGAGYFHIDPDGRLVVDPRRDGGGVRVDDIVDDAGRRGLHLPLLIRFDDVLADRVGQICGAFATAIADNDYRSDYRSIYPIKVNQQRGVVETLTRSLDGRGGLEAGSRAELLIAMAVARPGMPIIINGLKDDAIIELALHASTVGHHVIPVVEKTSELERILRLSKRTGIRGPIGIRVKLATRGSGRWQASVGYNSKFGLTCGETLTSLDRLQDAGMADCLEMLHFHVGSQIAQVRQLKAAMLEATRVYVDLVRRGAGLRMIDVGGGLGVDYVGGGCDHESSMNYDLQEYANNVIYHAGVVCDEAGVPHPTILSESGRSLAAHHGVLVVDVLETTTQRPGPTYRVPDDIPLEFEQPVHDIFNAYRYLTPQTIRESFHDAQASMDWCVQLFAGGYLPLVQRVVAEELYFALCERVRRMAEGLDGREAEQFASLDSILADTYHVNFSIFQSLADSWAIDQVFPVVPTSRLDQRPTRSAVLADITCDSDGKIARFPVGGRVRRTVRLHPVDGSGHYRLAIPMVGAYQETLGDLHNLFGDTHAIHVSVGGDAGRNEFEITRVVTADTVAEVVGYVGYDAKVLDRQIRTKIDAANLDPSAADRFRRLVRATLSGQTYLSGDEPSAIDGGGSAIGSEASDGYDPSQTKRRVIDPNASIASDTAASSR